VQQCTSTLEIQVAAVSYRYSIDLIVSKLNYEGVHMCAGVIYQMYYKNVHDTIGSAVCANSYQSKLHTKHRCMLLC
jgi:hypothetical protein